jgi:hypothetical protein
MGRIRNNRVVQPTVDAVFIPLRGKRTAIQPQPIIIIVTIREDRIFRRADQETNPLSAHTDLGHGAARRGLVGLARFYVACVYSLVELTQQLAQYRERID